MKKYFVLLMLPLSVAAQDRPLDKFIDSLVGPYNKPDVPGSMILIAQDGKPIVKKAYGMASLELSVPLTTNHSFAIGSISKQFTALAMLQLAEQGKLKLSDDIRKYFPGVNTHGYVVTIDNLLSHTSGISSFERKSFNHFVHENGIAAYPDYFLSYIMSEDLLFVPGTNWSYDNAAYWINALIIEKVSGEKFADYMREHVFRPAGMLHSFVADDLQPLNNLAISYSKGYQGKWRNENSRTSYWEWPKGGGNIISTLDDMMQWDIALREGKILSKQWLQRAWTAYVLKTGFVVHYGYGWYVSNYGGVHIISHSGAIYSYSVESVHLPEKKLYILYVNFYGSDPASIPKNIISTLLNIPFYKAIDTSANKLSDYIGDYETPHATSRLSKQVSDRPIYANFTTSGDTLYMQYTGREKIFLRPAGKDRFLPAHADDPLYVFNRDERGKVKSFQVIPFLFGGAMSDEAFKKIQRIKKPLQKIVFVNPEVLKRYTGTYYRPVTDRYFFIELNGGKLYAYQMNAAERFELLPIGQNKFIRKGIEDSGISFKVNLNGLMILTFFGNRIEDYKKIAE